LPQQSNDAPPMLHAIRIHRRHNGCESPYRPFIRRASSRGRPFELWTTSAEKSSFGGQRFSRNLQPPPRATRQRLVLFAPVYKPSQVYEAFGLPPTTCFASGRVLPPNGARSLLVVRHYRPGWLLLHARDPLLEAPFHRLAYAQHLQPIHGYRESDSLQVHNDGCTMSSGCTQSSTPTHPIPNSKGTQ